MAKAINNLRKEENIGGGELTVEKVCRIRKFLRNENPFFESENHIKKLPDVINGMWIKINKNFPSIATTVFLLIAYIAIGFGFSTFTWGFIHGATNGEIVQIKPNE